MLQKLRPLALLPLLALPIAALHCGGTSLGTDGTEAGTGEGGPGGGDGGTNPEAVGATTASKIDLLLVVDDSASMSDKAKLLSASLGTLLTRLVSAGDVHLGVMSSSLGTMGGDVCGSGSNKQASLAHLSTVGPNDMPVPNAARGFLAYGGGASTDTNAFLADAEALVKGIGERGCGLEAQLESTYRFLVQPDPWQTIAVDTGIAKLQGVDDVLLRQRKAFLRPDSLVVVVMLTDEDDSTADPRSVKGQGWAFMSNQFPGSPVFRADGKTTTAPRATSACQTDPGSADCTSCGFAATCNPSETACQKIKSDPECQKNGGYYGPTEDQLNIRFHRMKERYGIDPQFPISRYVDGFTKERVPNRDGEHVEIGPLLSDYLGDANCTNPLFAAALPEPGGDLCNLPKGPRGKELVVFAVIGGVPEYLAGASPDWDAILGKNPGAFNFEGIDPHMIQSVSPRPGLPPPSTLRGDNGSDPIHGREWDTKNNDLQFACTFELPAVRTCTAQDPSCDCSGPDSNPPLCSTTLGTQLRAKAYPTPRELRVVKELGDRGIAGSICPEQSSKGYVGTMNTLADRLAPRIAK